MLNDIREEKGVVTEPVIYYDEFEVPYKGTTENNNIKTYGKVHYINTDINTPNAYRYNHGLFIPPYDNHEFDKGTVKITHYFTDDRPPIELSARWEIIS